MPEPTIQELGVSKLSLGTAGLGTELNQEHSNRLLDAYFEAGGNFLDTAHVYACWVPGGEGASEKAVGLWMHSRGLRDQVKISTKGGHPPMDIYPHAEKFLSPEAISNDVEESLDRLQTSYIDLYYLHRDDGETPVDEIIDALNGTSGIRWLGASNWSTQRVEAANAYAKKVGKRGFIALQNQWSLAVPDWSWQPTEDPTMRYITESDADWCAKNGLIIHPYSAAANGYFDRSDAGGYAGSEQVRERVRTLAEQLGRTPTQIALAWLLNQRVEVVPIVGTTKIPRLMEALGSLDHVLEDSVRTWLRP